jgi:hypothetical protein
MNSCGLLRVAQRSHPLTSAGFTSGGAADQLQCGIQPHGLPRVMLNDRRQALAEDALDAEAVPATEAARPEFKSDGHSVPEEVS